MGEVDPYLRKLIADAWNPPTHMLPLYLHALPAGAEYGPSDRTLVAP